jgi:hypothetical protein
MPKQILMIYLQSYKLNKLLKETLINDVKILRLPEIKEETE